MASDEYDMEIQRSEIKELLKTPLKVGDKWYLVDSTWFRQWKKYVGYDSWDAFSVGQSEAYPGPIDNSPLLEETTSIYTYGLDTTGVLKEHLIDELDYQLVPTSAWDKLCNWYSHLVGQVPIQRVVIEQGMFTKHCKVEVYRLDLKIRQKNCDGTELIINMSRSNTIGEIHETVRKIFNITENYTLVLYYKYMANTYEKLTKLSYTIQDTALYSGQVIAFESYQDGHLVYIPFIPIQKEEWGALQSVYKIAKEKEKQETAGENNPCGDLIKKDEELNFHESRKEVSDTNLDKEYFETARETKVQDTSDKTDPGPRRTEKKDSEQRNISGLCEQCFRGNQESVSSRWCLDCDEPLCSVCDAAHHLNKTSMSHTTIVKETITNVSSAFVQIEKLCKNHPDIEVGFYCNVHSVLCCINCIPELHRSCDGIISLDDAAKTIEKSSFFNKITEEIECILETLENLQHDFKNNISNIQQEESVQHAVAQLKSKIVDHLNNLEKEMLTQLLVIKDNVVFNINAEIAALNPFVNEMTGIKTDIDFMIEHGARKHAFLLCQKLKEEMEAKHVRLTEIISSHQCFSLSFNPSVEIDQLKAKINSFGVITVTEEPKQIADKRHTSAQGNVVTRIEQN